MVSHARCGAGGEIRAFNLEERMEKRFLQGLLRWIKYHLKVVKYRYMVPPGIDSMPLRLL